MRIVPLICVLTIGAVECVVITPASAFAPGPNILAATNHLGSAATDEAAPLVEVKWKAQPPGWSRGRKTGWRGWGVPPGQLKKL